MKKSETSEVHHDQVLDYVWVLKSVPSDEDPKHVLMSGGLCVHPDGLLVTVAHGVKPECPGFKSPTLTALNFRGRGFRKATLIEGIKYKKFGLCFVRLEKLEENEVFTVCPFPKKASLTVRSAVFAFIHASPLPIAFHDGYTCYEYPLSVMNVPLCEDDCFPTDSDIDTRRVQTLVTLKAYGAGSLDLSKRAAVRDYIGDGLHKSLLKLNGTMPLLHVSGLRPTMLDGQCGCPLFRSENNALVGLIAFTNHNYQFIIPVQVVREVFERNFDILGLAKT